MSAGPAAARAPLLSVRNLAMHFPVRSGLFGRTTGVVRAVDGVSLDVFAGETLGVVGESGCGKTTLGRSILRLIEPTAGTIEFDGVDFRALKGAALRRMRRHLQIIFQDPFSSLNPRLTVGTTIREGLLVHRIAEGADADARVARLLDEVGLQPAYATRYPHEFSGGQRQRIGIARALAVEPRLIVCDEPVSALDVSVQAQVINLLKDLQRDRGLAYLFIAHDLSVVEHMADRVAVMYLGRVMELARAADLYREPLMPYTQALLSAVPVPDPERSRTRIVLAGDPPSPANPPSGCVFHPRCHHPAKDASCGVIVPPLEEKAPQHWCACIKQPPTIVPWETQERAGASHRPTRHLPEQAIHHRV
ncbi:MAG: ATP-binding cassette domain-containing protein [Gemmatimonadaceae bacterium]|nr:ATP-binding cassette domain-containing protein [Gemmatimonadaceae bacterium]